MGLPRENRLASTAEFLRLNMTPHGKKLWFKFLSGSEIPFVPQKVIGPYIVDFFCNKVRLSIEIDGSQHYEPENVIKDRLRTNYLEMLEIKELRFSNADIRDSFEGVCEIIYIEVEKRRNDVITVPIQHLYSKH